MTINVGAIRVVSSTLLAVAFASIITNLATSKIDSDIALTALLALLFAMSRNLIRGIYFFATSFAISSLIVSLNSMIGFINGKNSSVLLVLMSTVWLILIVLSELIARKSTKFRSNPVLDLYVVLLSLPLSIYWSRGGESSALKYLASSGEDNGAWLQGLSFGISEGGPIYNSASYFGGGTTLSSFHAMAQAFFSGINHSQVTNLDNVLILQREYGLLTLFIVSIAFGISYLKLDFVNETSRVFGSSVIALMTYASASAVMASGHLSALVTIWLIFALFAIATESKDASNQLLATYLTICGVFLILAASRSWYPLMPVGAIVIIGLLVRTVVNLYADAAKHNFSSKYVKILAASLASIMLLLLAATSFNVLRPYIIGSWEELLKNIGYGGGSYSASALLLGIVIIVVAINAIDLNARNFRVTNIEILFLTLTLLYLMVVTLLSQVSPPNRTIMYSAIKLQLVFVVLALPFVVRWIYQKFNNSKSNFSLVFISSALLTLFVFEVSLGQFVNYPLKMKRDNVVWASGVVKALKADENARMVCLNPNTDGQDYAAYVCSRMSSGITGGFSEPDSIWQAKHLGSISNERFRDEIPQSFYDDLTIVSFDPDRRLSDDPARQDWMQYIPWQRVNVVGIK